MLAQALISQASAGGGKLPAMASHGARPRFSAEVSACVEADSVYALLNVEVPYRELSFRKVSGGMEAQFDLIVHILQGDRQVAGDLWHERLRISGRSELKGRKAKYLKQLSFPLPPGQYTLEVRVSELQSGHEGILRIGTHIPMRIPGQIVLSSILVGACGLEAALPQLRQDPRIGSDIAEPCDTLCAYAELYHPGLENPDLRLRWCLRGSTEKLMHEGKLSAAGGAGVTRISWRIPVGDLWIDTYRLEAVATVGDQQSRAATTFSLLAEPDRALSNFIRESLEVLAYIADDDEMERLQMASAGEWKAAWDEFWKLRDPNPDTEQNEFKEEFFRRVRTANEEFTVMQPGWQTDRGRIYITYGDPDQIGREPYSSWGRPMEIWYYDSFGMRFVFLDRSGFGDYELVQPDW